MRRKRKDDQLISDKWALRLTFVVVIIYIILLLIGKPK